MNSHQRDREIEKSKFLFRESDSSAHDNYLLILDENYLQSESQDVRLGFDIRSISGDWNLDEEYLPVEISEDENRLTNKISAQQNNEFSGLSFTKPLINQPCQSTVTNNLSSSTAEKIVVQESSPESSEEEPK